MPSETQLFGFAREATAQAYLEARGYRVVDRNWRGYNGEVDIVAWDGDILCFVEVRARSRDDCGLPMETVDHKKQRKLIRAALGYLTKFSPRAMPMARFDVVSIQASTGEVTLIPNAFDAGR
jgi:putative endonuclease